METLIIHFSIGFIFALIKHFTGLGPIGWLDKITDKWFYIIWNEMEVIETIKDYDNLIKTLYVLCGSWTFLIILAQILMFLFFSGLTLAVYILEKIGQAFKILYIFKNIKRRKK